MNLDISNAILNKGDNGSSDIEVAVFVSELEREKFINALVLKPRDQTNEEAVRRAFNAVNSICEYSKASEHLQEKAHNRISTFPLFNNLAVKEALSMFDLDSRGSHKHFRKLLIDLSRRHFEVIDLILDSSSPITKRPYLIEMLRYVHEPAVTDCIVMILFHPSINESVDLRDSRYEKIDKMDFMNTLLSQLRSPYNETSSGIYNYLISRRQHIVRKNTRGCKSRTISTDSFPKLYSRMWQAEARQTRDRDPWRTDCVHVNVSRKYTNVAEHELCHKRTSL
jgi:hypothetical protein